MSESRSPRHSVMVWADFIDDTADEQIHFIFSFETLASSSGGQPTVLSEHNPAKAIPECGQRFLSHRMKNKADPSEREGHDKCLSRASVNSGS